MDRIKKILQEPLVQFLIIGAFLFLLFHFMNDPINEKSNKIVITQGQIDQLSAKFSKTWLSSPTNEQLIGLIKEYVRDEVYYREGLALGLDKGDPLINSRIRQKIEFIIEGTANTITPTNEELEIFFQNNIKNYQQELQITFYQVYIKSENNNKENVEKILSQLRNGKDPKSIGDPTLIAYKFTLVYQNDIAKQFGEEFVKEIFKIKLNKWTGPISSGLGNHLVLVKEIKESIIPQLNEVRSAVERDWMSQQRDLFVDAHYKKLLENYEVIIEPLKND